MTPTEQEMQRRCSELLQLLAADKSTAILDTATHVALMSAQTAMIAAYAEQIDIMERESA